MTDQPEPANITHRSGGADLNAGRDLTIGGDVVGRDKIVQNISHIINTIAQRPLSAAEEIEQARSIETQLLRQGVTAYVQRLHDRVSESTDTGGPFKGLLEYRLSDAAIFFGRSRAIAELSEHVQRSPLTVLHAESGAGKTSLLQAGLSPYLIAAGHLPIYLRPYNVNPALAVKRALVVSLSDTPNLAQASLREVLSQATSVLGPKMALYLFLDQFEEFFTRLEEVVRARFIEELAECLDDTSLNVRWVVALRTEFFGNLANFRPRIRNPFENDYRLNRLTWAEAQEVVVEPASHRGLTFEGGLIDTVLDDLGQDEIAPPQIQLVCSALYEALPPDSKIITRQMYADQQGVEGILREHLSRVLHRDLPTDQRAIAQSTLEALITSDAQRVLRTRAELAAEFTLHATNPDTLDHILDQLVDSRLLRVEEVADQPAYELAHDYLLTEIKLDPSVQARKAAQELLEQEVHAYQRYGTLLNDDKYAILAPRRQELVLTADAQTLLDKSQHALQRRQRLLVGGIGLVIVLVVVGALSIIAAIGAQSAAANAESQKASAVSSAATAQSLQSTAEAGAAVAVTREAVANVTLQRAFEQTGIIPVGKTPAGFAFDGKTMWVTNSNDNAIQSIDPTSGRLGNPIEVGEDPTAIVFDGTRLWVANQQGDTVQSVDPNMGQAGEPIKVGLGPHALAFDGKRLWVACFDGTLQPIDPITHATATPIRRDGRTPTIAFDGKRLWVASDAGGVAAIDPETGEESATILVGTYPSDLAYDVVRGRLWVAHDREDTVQAFDPATGVVGQPIIVGSGPGSLAFDTDPLRAQLWVANYADNTVQVIDPVAGTAGTPIPVGQQPAALAFDTRRGWLWVANAGDDTVQAIDPAIPDVGKPIKVASDVSALALSDTQLWIASSGTAFSRPVDLSSGNLGRTITVGNASTAMIFDPRQAGLWVTDRDSDAVRLIDLMTGAARSSIPVGQSPSALALDTRHGLVWVANSLDGTIQSIDPATGQVGVPISVGGDPKALAFDGQRLWVANSADGTVQAVDPVTGQVDSPISVGAGPWALIYDESHSQLWVANAIGNTVQAIDRATGQVAAPISVGNFPCALALDLNQARLWVANCQDNAVQVVDSATGKVGTPITVGERPNSLAFDAAHRRLWVGNDDGTVQSIVVH